MKHKVKVVFDDLDIMNLTDLKELKRLIMKSYGTKGINEKEMESSYWTVDKTIGNRIFSNWKDNMDHKREYGFTQKYSSTQKEFVDGFAEEFEHFKAVEALNGAEFNS